MFVARMTGAAVRGLLVALLIALPSLMMPTIATHSPELVVLAALCGGLIVFAEYASSSPTILEFRNAGPFNRLRFIWIGTSALSLSLLLSHGILPTGLSALISLSTALIKPLLDFPLSPVTLFTDAVSSDMPKGVVRSSATLSYSISLVSILAFLGLFRFAKWPAGPDAFNVWLNLPLFDPTAGGDVIAHLRREGKLHIFAGISLPFALPAMFLSLQGTTTGFAVSNALVLVWLTTAWSMIPAGLVVRGMARFRVAHLIAQKRRAVALGTQMQPA